MFGQSWFTPSPCTDQHIPVWSEGRIRIVVDGAGMQSYRFTMKRLRGHGAGLPQHGIGRIATISRQKPGSIIGLIIAVAMGPAGCGLAGEGGTYVQARRVDPESSAILRPLRMRH